MCVKEINGGYKRNYKDEFIDSLQECINQSPWVDVTNLIFNPEINISAMSFNILNKRALKINYNYNKLNINA